MNKSFEQEIVKGKWMFFVYSSPSTFPFNFFLHTWIVIASPEKEIHRYEIHWYKNKQDIKQGYLHIDNVSADEGLMKYFWIKGSRFKSTLLLKIFGDNGSLAHRVVKFVENNINNYKFKDRYSFISGPNCNTFTQWILDEFPEIELELPKRAIGSRFQLNK